MRITEIRLKNFGVFEDLTLTDLPPFAIFIGPNGTGKSTLIDLFAFIQDALRENVRAAIDRRGGFNEVRTRERSGHVTIEMIVQTGRSNGDEPAAFTYGLSIGLQEGQPVIKHEQLRVQSSSIQPNLFDFAPSTPSEESLDDEEAALERKVRDNEWQRGRLLLGSPMALARTFRSTRTQDDFTYYLAASELYEFLSNVHLSDIQVSKARQAAAAGRDEHISIHGDNLPVVSKFMHDEHPAAFELAVKALGKRVPEVSDVSVEYTIDRRVALQFFNTGLTEPFGAASVSDGTLKMWAYLLMLHDPEPHPLMCIEDPENQLYHSLLGVLAEELWSYANRSRGQVFVTTHSTDLLDSVEPHQVFWLVKREGVTHVRRASEDPHLVEEFEYGNKLGWMWKSRAFDGAYPD